VTRRRYADYPGVVVPVTTGSDARLAAAVGAPRFDPAAIVWRGRDQRAGAGRSALLPART
jgi:hypothetical protein